MSEPCFYGAPDGSGWVTERGRRVTYGEAFLMMQMAQHLDNGGSTADEYYTRRHKVLVHSLQQPHGFWDKYPEAPCAE